MENQAQGTVLGCPLEDNDVTKVYYPYNPSRNNAPYLVFQALLEVLDTNT